MNSIPDRSESIITSLNVLSSELTELSKSNPSLFETIDILTDRLRDIIMELVMSPLFCTDGPVWWPVCERNMLLLQLIESRLSGSVNEEEKDILLHVHNTVSLICTSIMVT